jgi:hypothetical protein
MNEIPTPIEDVQCEACESGFRRASDGLHYDDAHGGATWGQCRKITEAYHRERLATAQTRSLSHDQTHPRPTRPRGPA